MWVLVLGVARAAPRSPLHSRARLLAGACWHHLLACSCCLQVQVQDDAMRQQMWPQQQHGTQTVNSVEQGPQLQSREAHDETRNNMARACSRLQSDNTVTLLLLQLHERAFL